MTQWLSHRMVERGIIKEEEQELYQFGIRNGMILLLNVVTALVIGKAKDRFQYLFLRENLSSVFSQKCTDFVLCFRKRKFFIIHQQFLLRHLNADSP